MKRNLQKGKGKRTGESAGLRFPAPGFVASKFATGVYIDMDIPSW
jgi:hypothetical protein